MNIIFYTFAKEITFTDLSTWPLRSSIFDFVEASSISFFANEELSISFSDSLCLNLKNENVKRFVNKI